MAVLAVAGALACCSTGAPQEAAPPGARDAIAAPLEGLAGDAARGLTMLRSRDPANCVLCHAVPGLPLAGDLGPPLGGVGTRLTPAQLRQRVVDERRVVPQTIMPAYHATDGLRDVAPQYRGRPILDAQQVEDVVAFLSTLK